MRKVNLTFDEQETLDKVADFFHIDIEKIFEAYYETGVEDMRQAAIKECLKLARSESYYSDNIADDCAEEIQKINLKEAK